MNFMPQSEQTKARLAAERKALIDRSERFSRQLGRSPYNKVLLEGFVGVRDERRYTAAGLPVVKMQLRYIGQQSMAHTGKPGLHAERMVMCEISVLFIGSDLCSAVDRIAENSLVRVKGFLTRNAYKDELSWVILEAMGIEIIEDAPDKNASSDE
ncbi:MAG: hypothetical protein VX185_05710 [Pseudomonadota bacterium]|nr:hypothetical protein [Gammaproteobacteria bacterium]MEC8010251.1 hypothetical protein [Pseudomonadota bacterium]HBF08459.1 hypothetical protein [Gammaproteobacteria bacterium]|tara:strand:+ start:78233 stop:78697 length:465 start_codon:yes stop_codon:yes gene_type:complete